MIKSSQVKRIGLDIGFDIVSTSQLKPSENVQHVQKWINDKYHGSMKWYPKNIERRLYPQKHLFSKALSAITVGLYYRPKEIDVEILNDSSRGIIARYALYHDYHKIMEKMLKDFASKLDVELNGNWHYHVYVDTGPVLEREIAKVGGLGFIGKNTTLINTTIGSYLFLGEIICDLDFTEPIEGCNSGIVQQSHYGNIQNILHSRFGKQEKVKGTCGECNRCQRACPTQAFVSPYTLDARRCISYLTIENRGAIPIEFRKLIGNRIYGCDICQEVCPWNKRMANKYKSVLEKKVDQAPYLLDLVGLSEEQFREKYKSTPILRAKRAGFVRNVLVAIGNWGDESAFGSVQRLLNDQDALVRQHAVWALAQINTSQAKPFLTRLKKQETDSEVLAELDRLFD